MVNQTVNDVKITEKYGGNISATAMCQSFCHIRFLHSRSLRGICLLTKTLVGGKIGTKSLHLRSHVRQIGLPH